MRLTEVGTPVATTNRHHRELGDDDSSADSSSHFLRRLDSEPDVTFAVSDDHDSLESGTLTGTRLLLHWLDLFTQYHQHQPRLPPRSLRVYLHNLILQLRQEEVDDLVLLDRQRVQVDLLHTLDLAGLDETSELGDGLPFLLVALGTAATATASSTSSSAAIASSGAESASTAWCSAASVCHCC